MCVLRGACMAVSACEGVVDQSIRTYVRRGVGGDFFLKRVFKFTHLKRSRDAYELQIFGPRPFSYRSVGS